MEESYNWVMACIQSSNNRFQFECCRKLIALFVGKHKELHNWDQTFEIELQYELANQETKYNIDV